MLSYTTTIKFMGINRSKMTYKTPAKLFAIGSYLGLALLLAISMLVPLTAIHSQKAHATTLPAYGYTKTFDTTNGYASGNSVTADANGNVYLTGYFHGTVTFDGVGGSDSQTAANGSDGTFLTKYNTNGSYAWTKTFDTTDGNASGNSVTTDTNGNVYLTGRFSYTVVFDGVGGSDSQTAANGSDGTFLTKYNTNGSYAWTKTFDTTDGSADGYSVTTDTNGNVYLAGYFSGTIVFDGVGGSDSQTGASSYSNSFLTRYNANGSYAWTKIFDTTNGYASGSSVTTDANGNVYLAGYFSGTVTFDGVGGSDSQTATSEAGNNSFLTRYNTNGSYAWTKIFGGSSNGGSYGSGVTTDASGNIYLAGQFGGTVIFDGVGGSDSQTAAGAGSAFLTKYNANGSYAYTRTFDAGFGNAFGYSVITDTSGNIYLAGNFSGTVIFDGVGGSDSQTGVGNDAFLTRYNANGSYAWTKTFDTTDGNATEYGVASDINGDVYLTGSFYGTVIFDGVGGSDSRTTVDETGGSFLTKYVLGSTQENNPGNNVNPSSSSSTPTAPNTGFGVFTTNPLRTLAIYSLVSLGLGALALVLRRFAKQ
jgi:hypothetical protein